ncbi:flippase-like domain-containing protein [Heliorestis acidaminivorans]|uniref:Phosphatidylglycerol lysyltransferase n=1 Tax=Heliorestis acidaminivorans TaxID=553427 RepID=A0A6I0F0Z6_9FIRM|nr:lysylphosphatidylglycerol synthase transmembrane domain-containing protein [Heliorestis acidaminivorans]KAB2951810.1 flippase-like domain-containing protein [Heliorestis acidaminivorans]
MKALLYVVGLSILAFLLWSVPISELIDTLKSMDRTLLFFASLLQIFTVALIALQWYIFAKKIGGKVTYLDMVHMNLAGTFVESITPAMKAGGEGAKIWLLCSKMRFSLSQAVALLTLQKAISIVPFLLISAIGLSWLMLNHRVEGLQGQIFLGSFLFLLATTGLILLFLLIPKQMMALLERIPLSKGRKEKALAGIDAFRQAIAETKGDQAIWMGQGALSIFIWLLYPVKAYIVVLAFDVPISLALIGVITYLAYMVAMLPLSPGGIGTFEGAMVLLLSSFNIPLQESLALAVAIRFVTFWLVFLISAIYLASHKVWNLLQNLRKPIVS